MPVEPSAAGPEPLRADASRSAVPLVLNPGVEATRLDCAAQEPMVMCTVRGRSGRSARYTLPARLWTVLEAFDGRRTTPEALDAVAGGTDEAAGYTRDALDRLVTGFLVPKRILIPRDAEGDELEPRPSPGRASYLSVKVPLIPARVVELVARGLTGLYDRPVAVLATLAVVAAHVWFYLDLAPAAGLALDDLGGGDVVLVLLLMNVGTLAHEFGHATAAVRHGCRGTTIGWGLYLHMTVLYTDVSEAWRLPRLKRAVVDLGGIYFQALFLLGLLGLYFATGSPVPLFAFVLTDFTIANALNPFLRLDGYWLISDVFGIVNLRSQSARLGQFVLLRLLRRRGADAMSWTLDRRTTGALIGYTALSVLFFAYTAVLLLKWVGGGIGSTIPERVAAFVALATGPDPDWLAVTGAGFEVLWRGLALLGLGIFVYRLSRGIGRWARRLAALLRAPSGSAA